MRLPVLVGLLAALVGAPAAQAAGDSFTLDPGTESEDPHVAVDENGIGHFAWTESVPYESASNPGNDILRYCQVARNGTACTKAAAIEIAKDDFNGPRVLLPGDGRVLIITQRCCGGSVSLDVLWVVESLDGGASWSEPRAIGTTEPSGDAELGPGEFSVSVITSIVTGGTFFQAAALDGQTTERANVGEAGQGINNPFAYGDVAFADPLTPIVVMTDLETVYFRKWGGVGNYNDLGTWGPLQAYGPGDETEAAGGKRGVFMTYKTEEFPRRYRVARWGGMSFGESSPVTPRGDPIFGDLFQDRGGNLHFLWQENGPDELRHRMSRDGQTWKAAETLADSDDGGLFNLAHSTARDGGGFAVWDENGGGPVKAVQFGPTGPVKDLPEDESCVLDLTVGAAEIVAREGCLKKQKGKQEYRTTRDIRVNGVDLETAGGSGSAHASAAATIIIDKAARTLTTNGKVTAKVGNIVLDEKALSWRLPATGGQITDLAGNPATFDTAKFKVEFLSLPVSGQTSPKLTKDGGVEVPVHLRLPEPFGGAGGLGDITGDITLKAHVDTGLKLSNLIVRAKNVGLGIAEIEELVIEYVGDPSRLFGKANLLLPVIKGKLEAEFQLLDGEFDYAKGLYTVTPPSPGIPVATNVYLRQIGFSVFTDPTKIGGSLQLVGLGTIAGTPVLELNGSASYTFPDSPAPGIFRVDATGKIVGLGVGGAFFQYETTGKATFGGSFEIGDPDVLGIKGSAGGGADLASKKFDLFGDASACGLSVCASSSWIVSSKAAAICIEQSTGGIGDAIGTGDPAVTVVYKWGSGLDAFMGCNLGKYKAVSSAHAAQDGSRTFQVDDGLKLAGVEISGQGAAPRVTLTGPGGQTIASPADQSQAVDTEVGLLVADPDDSATLVALRKPQAGRWTITPQAGSVPITGLRTAEGLPAPKVNAKVEGKGLKRRLDYTVRQIDGQVVRFAEEGRGAYRLLGAAKGRRGTIRFTPANGARGKRSIIAIVEQDGLPRTRIVAGRYKAPGLIRPAKPRRVRLVRRAGRLVVRWRKAARARSYIVRAVLRDGRRLTIPTRKRKVRIGNVPGIDSGRILVHGVTKDGTIGPAKQAKLKAKPKKRKKRKRQ